MIICALEKFLRNRNLSILKFSEITGISRATLTSLSQNIGVGVQFDTLNKICSHLDISLDELLHYAPFDVTCSFDVPAAGLEKVETDPESPFKYEYFEDQFDGVMSIKHYRKQSFSVGLDCYISFDYDKNAWMVTVSMNQVDAYVYKLKMSSVSSDITKYILDTMDLTLHGELERALENYENRDFIIKIDLPQASNNAEVYEDILELLLRHKTK